MELLKRFRQNLGHVLNILNHFIGGLFVHTNGLVVAVAAISGDGVMPFRAALPPSRPMHLRIGPARSSRANSPTKLTARAITNHCSWVSLISMSFVWEAEM